MSNQQGSIKLGTLLVESGHISDGGLREALAEQSRSEMRLGEVLIYLGLITEAVLLDCLAKQFGVKRISLSALDLDLNYCRTLPQELAEKHNIVLYRQEQDAPVLVTSDPSDIAGINLCIKALKQRPVVYCALKNEISHLIDVVYHNRNTSNPIEISKITESEPKIGVSAFVDMMLNAACRSGASDVHIDCRKAPAYIRFRIDGDLYEQQLDDTPAGQPVLNRIKSMFSIEQKNPSDVAEVNTEFYFETEDGRSDKADLRICLLGDILVIRIDVKSVTPGTIDSLGIDDQTLDALKHRLSHTQGITLFAGASGAGRTSTLYAAANYLQIPKNKVIAFMPHQEHMIDGIEFVNSDMHNAQSILMLRDPDVILMDNVDSADAVQQALLFASAGVKVLSTVNAPTAKEACLRVMSLAQDSQLLSMRLDVIVAQRLVRQNCTSCKVSRKLNDGEQAMLEAHHVYYSDTAYDCEGCEHCQYRGIKGRRAVFEMMVISQDLRSTIRNNDLVKFNQYADDAVHDRGMLDKVALLVKSGDVSVSRLLNMINYPLE